MLAHLFIALLLNEETTHYLDGGHFKLSERSEQPTFKDFSARNHNVTKHFSFILGFGVVAFDLPGNPRWRVATYSLGRQPQDLRVKQLEPAARGDSLMMVLTIEVGLSPRYAGSDNLVAWSRGLTPQALR